MTVFCILGIGCAWFLGYMDWLSVGLFGGPLVCFSLMADAAMGGLVEDEKEDLIEKKREQAKEQREGMLMAVAREIQRIVDKSR